MGKRDMKKKARKKALKKKTSGPGIGDALVKSSGSAADWVARMRKKKPNDERIKALALAEELNKQDEMFEVDYTAADLQGLKVRHKADEFKKGEEIILTLKDNPILKNRGHEENMDEDELMNVTLADGQRDKRNHARRTGH